MTLLSKPKVLFVGAFPPKGNNVFGGNVTDCRILMNSSFSQRLHLDLIDSTQISNPPPTLIVRLVLAVRRILLFIWRVESNRPDVVLLFVALGVSAIEKGLLAWYSRLRGIPALIFPRGGGLVDQCKRSPLFNLVIKIGFKGANKMLCQGSAWQNFAINSLGFSIKNSPVILNWAASDVLLAIGKERTHSPPHSIVNFLFVGSLNHEKGIVELLEACRRLLDVGKKFLINIVGEGNTSQFCRDYVKNNELQRAIIFHGWLYGEQLENVLRKSDVFVLPSWEEGLPNAMIEAMAAKLAIIVSPVGNIPDVITDCENGLIVPPKNSKLLHAAMLKCIDEPELLIKIAKGAFETAKMKFSAEPAIELLISEIYKVHKEETVITCVE